MDQNIKKRKKITFDFRFFLENSVLFIFDKFGKKSILWAFALFILYFFSSGECTCTYGNVFKQPHLNNFKLRSSLWEVIKIMTYLLLTYFENMGESKIIKIKPPQNC